MSFNSFLKSIFGNKSDRDLKKLMPIVREIQKVYPEIEQLSNDELRARSAAIRDEIQEYVKPQRDEIAAIKAEIETLEYEEREPLWTKIDKIEKEVLERIEEKLNEVLPIVFSIVKDTARRFTENEDIEVTATDFDRKLAADGHDFLDIEGDKAIYHNTWVAGGNEMTWNMIHYDVQLPRWQLVRVRLSWPRCQCSSMRLQDAVFMWLLSTTTSLSVTRSGWVRSTCSTV